MRECCYRIQEIITKYPIFPYEHCSISQDGLIIVNKWYKVGKYIMLPINIIIICKKNNMEDHLTLVHLKLRMVHSFPR